MILIYGVLFSLFTALVVVAFAILFLRGLTLPLGLVLFARLDFVVVEGSLTRGRWRGLPVMIRVGLAIHIILATVLPIVGFAQLAGLL